MSATTAAPTGPCGTVAPLTIGSVVVDPPVLQAPMAGYTNYAYRQVVRECGGAGLLATEMIAARSATWMETHRGEHPDRLWGVREEPRPLAVQIVAWSIAATVIAMVRRDFAAEQGEGRRRFGSEYIGARRHPAE